jgi:hypothetical protein
MLQIFPAYDSLKAGFASEAADWIERVERLRAGMAARKMKSFSRSGEWPGWAAKTGRGKGRGQIGNFRWFDE